MNIRIISSLEKDIECLNNFLQESKSKHGDKEIFSWAIAPHKELVATPHLTKRIISAYVHSFYNNHEEKIAMHRSSIENTWRKKELKFFKLTEELFGDSYWPKGLYIGYLTIWGVYPRYLENKIFFVPWNHARKGYAYSVIAHELLHFKFYDFFSKKFPEYKNLTSNTFVWHVSEIFNAVIQLSLPWLRVFPAKPMLYPVHSRLVRKCLIWWKALSKKDKNVYILIEKIIKELRNSKLTS